MYTVRAGTGTGVSHFSRPDDLSEYESFWPKSDDLKGLLTIGQVEVFFL